MRFLLTSLSSLCSVMVLGSAHAALTAAEGRLIANGSGTNDLRVLVGVAPAIKSGSIKDVQLAGATTTFDQQLESNGSVGPKVGLRYLHGTWFDPHWGLKYGLDGVYMHSAGRAKDKASTTDDTSNMSMDTLSLGLWIGPTVRVDIESFDFAADFCELELLLGGGPARSTASFAGASSNSATGWRYGSSFAVVFTSFSRWQYGFEAGYETIGVDGLYWSNTGASEVTAAGLSAALFVGRRL